MFIVKSYIDNYSSIIVESRLKELNIDTDILLPFEIIESEVEGYANVDNATTSTISII